MRTERFDRLQRQLDAQGVDGLVLLGSSSVAYATGAAAPAQDGDRAALFRPVAVVVKGDTAPHLYTLYVDGAPTDLPDDHLHGPLFPDLDDGIEVFAAALATISLPTPASASTIRPTRCCAACPGLTGSTPPMWSALRSSRRHRTKSRAYAKRSG